MIQGYGKFGSRNRQCKTRQEENQPDMKPDMYMLINVDLKQHSHVHVTYMEKRTLEYLTVIRLCVISIRVLKCLNYKIIFIHKNK